MRRERPLRIRMSPGDLLTRAVCRLLCLVALAAFTIPVGYVLLCSIRDERTLSLAGYGALLSNAAVLTGLKNSLYLSVVGTLLSLALEIPAAYALSKNRYRRLTDIFFLLGQFGVALLPLYLLLKRLELLNSLWGLILPTCVSVYYIQLLRSRMIGIAAELEEAAAMDGCGTLRYLLQILLPNIAPSVGVFAFFHLCAYWSNTLLARTFLTDEGKFPLTLVLDRVLIQNQASTILGSSATSIATIRMAEYGLCVLSALPPVLIFLWMRKRIRATDADGWMTM